MIATLLFVAFLAMMLMGVPIGAALGLAGAAAIALANADSQWFGLLAVPQNFYAGLGKYPLLAIPMFVLVGSIFDRSGVALRLVNFAVAMVGRGPGMLPLVAIAVAMFLGGISGSGPANAAAVGELRPRPDRDVGLQRVVRPFLHRTFFFQSKNVFKPILVRNSMMIRA